MFQFISNYAENQIGNPYSLFHLNEILRGNFIQSIQILFQTFYSTYFISIQNLINCL